MWDFPFTPPYPHGHVIIAGYSKSVYRSCCYEHGSSHIHTLLELPFQIRALQIKGTYRCPHTETNRIHTVHTLETLVTNCFEIQTYHFEIHSVVRSKDGVLSQTNQATRPPTTCWVHTTADMPARWHTLSPSYEEFSFSILIITICLCAHYSLIPRPSVTGGLGNETTRMLTTATCKSQTIPVLTVGRPGCTVSLVDVQPTSTLDRYGHHFSWACLL